MHFTCIFFAFLLLASVKQGYATDNGTAEASNGTDIVMPAALTMNETEPELPSFHGYGLENTYNFLSELATNYSSLTELYSIGQTTDGNDIHVIVIHDESSSSSEIEQVALIGAAHGNEPVTREVLLQFAYHLVTNADNTLIAELLRKAKIHILPELNVDGARTAYENYDSGPDCEGMMGHNNSEGYDIAWSFPESSTSMNDVEGSDDVTNAMVTGADGVEDDNSDGSAGMIDRELKEVTEILDWLVDKSFKLGATFFTGDGLYVEYPHFSLDDRREDEWTVLTHIAQTYAQAHPSMTTGTEECPNAEGTTDGLKSMVFQQNTMMLNHLYWEKNVFAIDVHLGCCNYDSMFDILPTWEDNKDALLMFCSLVLDDSNFDRQAHIDTGDYGGVPAAAATAAPQTTTTAAVSFSPVVTPGGNATTSAATAGSTAGTRRTTAKRGEPAPIKKDSKPKPRSSDDSKGLSNGAVAGIVVGSVLVIGGGAAAIVATGATAGGAATGAAATGASSAAAGTGGGMTSSTTSAAKAAEASTAAETSAANNVQDTPKPDVENPAPEQSPSEPQPEPEPELDDSSYDGRTSPV